MKKVEGIVPVLVTPFSDDGQVDADGLKCVLKFLGGYDIAAIWALGTGSEDMNLTMDERLQVAEIVTKNAPSGVDVILGAGFFALKDTLTFLEETKSLPVSSYHYMPYHNLLSADRLEWIYNTIADAASKPMWMYTSANWSPSLPHATIASLSKHDNICGIKYSTRLTTDMAKVIAMQSESFYVITAVAAQLLCCLQMGSPAHTSSLGSAAPELLLDVYKHFKANDLDGAKAAQKRLDTFFAGMPTTLKKDNFLSAAEEKYILSLRGVCGPQVSNYYRAASEEEQLKIRATIEGLGLLNSAAA